MGKDSNQKIEIKDLTNPDMLKALLKDKVKSYRENHPFRFKFLLAAIFILVVSTIPIWPQNTTHSVTLEVPNNDDRYGNIDQGIPIRQACGSFVTGEDFRLSLDEKNPYPDEEPFYSDDYLYEAKYIPLNYSFEGSTIGIFAIRSCQECLPENSDISVSDTVSCKMNDSSVYGYFESCSTDKYGDKTCERKAFVSGEGVPVVNSQKQFKVEMIPIIEKENPSVESSVITRYRVKMLITTREYQSLPYVPKIASALIFILNPVASVLEHIANGWTFG